MKTDFSLFLALRYLKPKRTFISVINVISILGVTLGVILLILVISVMNGFHLQLRKEVIGFDAHLVVSPPKHVKDWATMEQKIKETPNVTATAPFVRGLGIVQFEHRSVVSKIRGIDPVAENKVGNIQDYIIDGTFDLSGDSAVLEAGVANALRVAVGDTITIYSPGNLDELMKELTQSEKGNSPESIERIKKMCQPKTLNVTGIFETGKGLYQFILVSLPVGQELFGLKDEVQGLSVKVGDPYQAAKTKEVLSAKLGPDLSILTWMDLHKRLFDAIRIERSVMFFLLLFVIIEAAFGILSTLITVTMQKTREIGIMKAIGASTSQIVGVFLGQGIVVGGFGIAVGLGCGLLVVQFRNEINRWIYGVFHGEVYSGVSAFSDIPAEVVPADLVIICVSAFLICSVAALIPAWFATRLDAVKALRCE